MTKEQKQQERDKLLQDKYTYIWSYYLAMQLLEFSCAELLNNKLVTKAEKLGTKRVRNWVNNQLNKHYRQAKATKKDVDKAEDLSSHNLAAMLEIVGMTSQIPPTQIDWAVQEFFKLCKVAVNRHNKGQLQKQKQHETA